MDMLKTRLDVNRLHPLFVAEVIGIDVTRPFRARTSAQDLGDRPH